MVTIKVSEVSGDLLDRLVAKCEGHIFSDTSWYSSDWSQGGPIIERENISLAGKDPLHDRWAAMTQYGAHKHEGPTPLIAAMRCYCASKLGDTIEVPEGLV